MAASSCSSQGWPERGREGTEEKTDSGGSVSRSSSEEESATATHCEHSHSGSSGWSAILSLTVEALSLPWAEALDMACRRLQHTFTRVYHADSLGSSFPQGFLHSRTTRFSFIQLTELFGHLPDEYCGTALSCEVVKCYTVTPKSFEWMVAAKVGTAGTSHSWNITVGTCPACETDLFQSVNQSARSLAYCSAAGLGTSVSVSSFTSFATPVSKWLKKKMSTLNGERMAVQGGGARFCSLYPWWHILRIWVSHVPSQQ